MALVLSGQPDMGFRTLVTRGRVGLQMENRKAFGPLVSGPQGPPADELGLAPV